MRRPMDLTLPHGAGISGKKKGPENIRALVNGGGRLTMCQPASRADEHWCGLLRVRRPVGGEQARSAYRGVHPQSGK
jgi:hypothetical protein